MIPKDGQAVNPRHTQWDLRLHSVDIYQLWVGNTEGVIHSWVIVEIIEEGT